MSNVKSSNERNVIRLLLDVKNNRYVISTFSFVFNVISNRNFMQYHLINLLTRIKNF